MRTNPRTRWTGFRHDRRGTSAIEFALVAPVLIAALLGVVETANYVVAGTAMDRAIRAGGQYIMNGGTDETVVAAIVRRSWTDAPEKSEISVQSNCLCAGVAQSCSATPCSGGGLPEIHTEISVSAVLPGMFISYPRTKVQTIRVQ